MTGEAWGTPAWLPGDGEEVSWTCTAGGQAPLAAPSGRSKRRCGSARRSGRGARGNRRRKWTRSWTRVEHRQPS